MYFLVVIQFSSGPMVSPTGTIIALFPLGYILVEIVVPREDTLEVNGRL